MYVYVYIHTHTFIICTHLHIYMYVCIADIDFIAALMYEGFLPMANRVAGPHKYCLLPKLHHKRCLITLNGTHNV